MIVFLITTVDKTVFNRSNSKVLEKETTLIALTQIIYKTQLNTSKHIEKNVMNILKIKDLVHSHQLVMIRLMQKLWRLKTDRLVKKTECNIEIIKI